MIDLNSDLGEGFGAWSLGDDDAMLEVVTSANVACGFHAGDPGIMRRVCAKAAALGVTIGAQVGYRDLAGFGRRPIGIAPAELTDETIYQLAALDGFARVAGSRVRYVKPHGALYNTVVTDSGQASALVEAVVRYDSSLAVLGLPGSEFLRIAEEAGLATVREAFADRGYTAEGHLVDRRLPGALVTDPELVAARSVRIATTGEADTADGGSVAIEARSLCVHGDTPGAVELARAVRTALAAAGVRVEPFVR
ncbi:MAG: 5-oxoprolinase (ATP-hydrolyzing) subunit [Cryptosporangiaceae bacterium]|nr:5-oxoprolinase (ATP-hydrolyzing) subunit [Cryptosporangiaceae bacterium]